MDEEQKSHTILENIKSSVQIALDVQSETNSELITNCEINNYLNGNGNWKYENKNETTQENTTEPPKERFGNILKEIIEVAEGPDPAYVQLIPEVPLSVVFIGKPFTGKTTQAQQLAERYACMLLEPEQLIKNAISAFETVSIHFIFD